MNTTTKAMTIGTVAKQVGVPIDTIRFYEREGLLPTAPRQPSGYRSYDESAVRQLHFIRRAKQLGFSLEEIRDLLSLSANQQYGVGEIRRRAELRLQAIEKRIAELQRIQNGLKQLVSACPGHGIPEQCPILRALADDEELTS